MHLVQILLPLFDNARHVLHRDLFREVRRELTERFGGLTAYTRAPAEGLWMQGTEAPNLEDIVVHEVMVENLDRAWWRAYRQDLETRFRQETIVVRANEIELL